MDFAGVTETDKALRISATQWHKLQRAERPRQREKAQFQNHTSRFSFLSSVEKTEGDTLNKNNPLNQSHWHVFRLSLFPPCQEIPKQLNVRKKNFKPALPTCLTEQSEKNHCIGTWFTEYATATGMEANSQDHPVRTWLSILWRRGGAIPAGQFVCVNAEQRIRPSLRPSKRQRLLPLPAAHRSLSPYSAVEKDL